MRTLRRSEDGFTLVDLLAVIFIIGVIAAIALPSMLGTIERMRLGQSARELERELQTAKSRAVAKGRPIRIRFNCPAAGQYRIVEVIGSATVPVADDDAADRCSNEEYPYPSGDNDPMTRPNLDGPLRQLDPSVVFAQFETIEFWPDGTAHHDAGIGSPWPPIPVAGISVQIAREGELATITVNGIGKVQLQPLN